jgi:hypothetical protein
MFRDVFINIWMQCQLMLWTAGTGLSAYVSIQMSLQLYNKITVSIGNNLTSVINKTKGTLYDFEMGNENWTF